MWQDSRNAIMGTNVPNVRVLLSCELPGAGRMPEDSFLGVPAIRNADTRGKSNDFFNRFVLAIQFTSVLMLEWLIEFQNCMLAATI